jgi:hypothetical protein
MPLTPLKIITSCLALAGGTLSQPKPAPMKGMCAKSSECPQPQLCLMPHLPSREGGFPVAQPSMAVCLDASRWEHCNPVPQRPCGEGFKGTCLARSMDECAGKTQRGSPHPCGLCMPLISV